MRTRMLTLVLLASAIARGANLRRSPSGSTRSRQWERWPVLRVGARAYMRSTYDRDRRQRGCRREPFPLPAGRRLQRRRSTSRGRASFASRGTTTGTAARGITRWTASTTWSASRATADPTGRSTGSTFLPRGLFPEPLAWTWSTRRAPTCRGFRCRSSGHSAWLYGRTHYGTGYYIYPAVRPGAAALAADPRRGTARPRPTPTCWRWSPRGHGLAPRPGTPGGDAAGVARWRASST